MATEGRHYVLRVNYRSTQALMNAVNHCFQHAEAERETGAFGFRSAAGNPLPYVAVAAKGREERWVDADGPRPALTLVHDLEPRSAKAVRKLFAARCAEQITAWLNDLGNGFARDGGRFERLRPRDIAVLVRTGKEAAAMRFALQWRGVASVYLSDLDSVFQGEEARDLVHWLRGVATPQDAALVRAALALRTLDLSLAELDALFSDDEAFDRQALELRELQQVWQSQGVLAMLRQTLHRFDLAARWLAQDGGERRLTNFLHLAELLQDASRELEGEQALIRWLQHQIDERAAGRGAGGASRERRRPGQDRHGAQEQGTGIPVVCLPFGTSFREVTRQLTRSATLPGERRARAGAAARRCRPGTRRPRAPARGPASALRGHDQAAPRDLDRVFQRQGRPEREMPEPQERAGLSGRWQRDRGRGGLAGTAAAAGRRAGADSAGRCPFAGPGPGQVTRLRRQDKAAGLAEPLHYDADFDRQWSIASYRA